MVGRTMGEETFKSAKELFVWSWSSVNGIGDWTSKINYPALAIIKTDAYAGSL
jgi:hypothetical protein